MKQFLGKILWFAFFAAICIWGLLFYYHVTQKSSLDPFYRRFTTGRYPSLILGSSRAAQGLRPDVFDKKLGQKFTTPFFNYSFTLGTSNIGPNYLKKIKTRIKKSENGLFVLCVSPWTMTRNIADSISETFKENDTYFAKQITQNMTPNVEYLILRDNKNQSFFHKIFMPDSSIYNLHKNGWLQVNYYTTPEKAEENSKWQQHLLQEDLKKVVLSDKRFEVLEEMITYLDDKGTVILVRMPTSSGAKNIEVNGFPDFDSRINSVANKHHVSYFNLIEKSGEYKSLDGIHIHKDDTEKISEEICDLILKTESLH